ncbi:uncharacterized protein LOC143843944 isoform X2 [Paroedura picta]|uniref:uncharacterized protein LOC143843944 isoform X2 n=1 Tax=Paroedura picta TaxID=143630 RepID=UPI004055FD23
MSGCSSWMESKLSWARGEHGRGSQIKGEKFQSSRMMIFILQLPAPPVFHDSFADQGINKDYFISFLLCTKEEMLAAAVCMYFKTGEKLPEGAVLSLLTPALIRIQRCTHRHTQRCRINGK